MKLARWKSLIVSRVVHTTVQRRLLIRDIPRKPQPTMARRLPECLTGVIVLLKVSMPQMGTEMLSGFD